METINEVVLITIAIVAVISLIKEMEPGVETLHEVILKIVFGSIAAGALFAVFYDASKYYCMLNVGVLIVLIDRLVKTCNCEDNHNTKIK